MITVACKLLTVDNQACVFTWVGCICVSIFLYVFMGPAASRRREESELNDQYVMEKD